LERFLRILILGVGNEFMRDDGCGVCISEALRGNVKGADVINAATSGLSILNEIANYDILIIVDAALIEEPARVFELDIREDYEAATNTVLDLMYGGSHNLSIESLIYFNNLLFSKNFEKVIIIGCKPKSLEFGLGLTDEGVNNALRVVEKLEEVLRKYGANIENIDEVKKKVMLCGNRSYWS